MDRGAHAAQRGCRFKFPAGGQRGGSYPGAGAVTQLGSALRWLARRGPRGAAQIRLWRCHLFKSEERHSAPFICQDAAQQAHLLWQRAHLPRLKTQARW